MIGVSVFIIIAVCAEWSSAQFLNHRPYPTYSLENMPDTGFSCRDKILGGYYADPETECQMFHVCVKVSGVGVQDFRFLCSNGTAFDQDHQICADWQDVDCDATTLYYSSDNFDLYRIGSGFESKAFKYGEDEEPFSLQRAETGDVRINREHQSQRINQQRENYNYRPTNNHYHQNSNRNSYSNSNGEKDIFKSSSSSNFFNNRNGGKETEDDEYESVTNANQDNDQYQRRKLAGRKQNRRPNYESPTERPQSNGFSNNFAGSSYLPTSTTARSTPTVTENDQYNTRSRQRIRVSPQYNNADNFRQTTKKGYEDDGRYRGESYNNNGQYNRNSPTTQHTVSTPTPFRQSQYNSENSTPRYNFNPTTSSAPQAQSRSTENYPSAYNQPQQRYNNNQNTQRVTENYPATNLNKQENYPTASVQTQTHSKEIEGYRNTQQRYNNNQNTQRVTENYPATNLNKQENYPTASVQTQTHSKEIESYRNTQQRYNNNQNTQRVTENYPATNLNKQENYPTASVQTQTHAKETESYRNTPQGQQYQKDQYETTKVKPYENHPSPYNPQIKKPTTPFKQTENYPTTYAPKQTKDFRNVPYTDQSSTFSPETNPTYSQGSQQPTTYNKPSTHFTPPIIHNQQQHDTGRTTQNTHPTSNQPTFNQQNFKQTQIYNSAPLQRQTPQYTQYTPTVPRITTPYHTSTTPAAPRRSNRFDETQYDDGSYNSKYDNEDNKREDEFLKAAHSINIASSRNEYNQNNKNVPSTTQKPRPFSVTPTAFKTTENLSNNTHKANINKSSSPPVTNNNRNTTPAKRVKDVSYDYAYYDTNVGSDHEYDIAVDIEKSDKTPSKKQ